MDPCLTALFEMYEKFYRELKRLGCPYSNSQQNCSIDNKPCQGFTPINSCYGITCFRHGTDTHVDRLAKKTDLADFFDAHLDLEQRTRILKESKNWSEVREKTKAMVEA